MKTGSYPVVTCLSTFEMGRFRHERYYRLEDNVSAPAIIDEFTEIFEVPVKTHLRSDFASERALLVGWTRRLSRPWPNQWIDEIDRPDFAAFTARSEDKETDESEWSRLVVNHCGINWHMVCPRFTQFDRHIEECLGYHDEPITGASVFLQYWIVNAASKAGVKVMLDGEGG